MPQFRNVELGALSKPDFRPAHWRCQMSRPVHTARRPPGASWTRSANSEFKTQHTTLKTQNSTLRSSAVQMYCAWILIESARFPPFGFGTVEISSNLSEVMPSLKPYRARILVESARVPPFGFDTVEISSNLNEIMPFLQKRLIVPGF